MEPATQKDQSAQAPLLRYRQSDKPLPAHLVGSKRLRSFCASMAQDIEGFHGNSKRAKIFSSQQEYGGKFGNFILCYSTTEVYPGE
jgi:hypothetical protein